MECRTYPVSRLSLLVRFGKGDEPVELVFRPVFAKERLRQQNQAEAADRGVQQSKVQFTG